MAARTNNSSAKELAAERAVQVVTSTANLMHLLRNSSHSETVAQLPKDLAAKLPNIKSTGKLLEQMPSVIVGLDIRIDDAVRSASHLEKVKSLLSTNKANG